MRLIDADVLMKNYGLETATKYGNKDAEQQKHSYSTLMLYEIAYMIEDAPTVEAVPVVHCKNCKHWGTGVAGETEHVKCCEYGKYMVDENGYCVYGEKV